MSENTTYGHYGTKAAQDDEAGTETDAAWEGGVADAPPAAPAPVAEPTTELEPEPEFDRPAEPVSASVPGTEPEFDRPAEPASASVSGTEPEFDRPAEPVSAPEPTSDPAARAVEPAGDGHFADHLTRMHQIQLAFIDDPRQAALDAEELLSEALQSFTEALGRERDALRGQSADGTPDTERMRLAVRRSRQLIDALASVD